MRLRRLMILPIAAIAGGLGAAIPALTAGAALPSSASFTVVDYKFEASTGGSEVTIATGGTVSFAYPSGQNMHNVDFGHGPQPSSCELNGTPQAPPVPSNPAVPGWSASCTFDNPGTYTFHCDMHPQLMTGKVIVSSSTTTTTSTTTATSTSTTTTDTTTTPASPPPAPTTTAGQNPPPPNDGSSAYPSPTTTSTTSAGMPGMVMSSPLASTPKRAIEVAVRQHGRRITGAILVSRAGHGGRAKVVLRIKTQGRPLTVGKLTLRHLSSGHVSFAVKLAPVGVLHLQRFGHLEVTVAITVTSPSGMSVSTTRRVRLRV